MAKTFEFDAYIIMLCDPERADYKAQDYATELDVPVTQIYKWNSQVKWDEIKAERRKSFSRRTSDVDNSLFKATKKGDVAAIRTWYERFDQWTPASKVLSEQVHSDAELDEAINGLLKLAGHANVAAASGGEDSPEAGRAIEVFPAEPGPAEVHQ